RSFADAQDDGVKIHSSLFTLHSSTHTGSQYENFTRNTSSEGASGRAPKSLRIRKSPTGATSARFSFQTTYSAEPGRNSQRTTALPRTLRKLKSGLPNA